MWPSCQDEAPTQQCLHSCQGNSLCNRSCQFFLTKLTGFVFIWTANETVGKSGRKQADHDGFGGCFEVARLSVHCTVPGLFCDRIGRLDLYGVDGHLLRQATQTSTTANHWANHRQNRRCRNFPLNNFIFFPFLSFIVTGCYLFGQTVKALHYLKETHGVIHRDVKPSNILLDERGNVKLCDFGISGWLEDSKAKTRSAGCAAYMAVNPLQHVNNSFEKIDLNNKLSVFVFSRNGSSRPIHRIRITTLGPTFGLWASHWLKWRRAVRRTATARPTLRC